MVVRETRECILSVSKKNHKTYEWIVDRIRAAISSKELIPGDRLPPEMDLAKQLGVSRPTVREALKVLEAQNILRSSTGPTGGTFVKKINGLGIAEYLKDSISMLLDLDELTLEEIWSAREAIESPSAGLAAVRRTDQDLFVIENTIELDEQKEGDVLVSDISFHRAVAEASKNRMLSLFMSSTYMTLKKLAEHYILPTNMIQEIKQASQDQHRLIYEAIAAQDEFLSSTRMQEHLSLSREVYTQAMPKKLVEATLDGHQMKNSYPEAT